MKLSRFAAILIALAGAGCSGSDDGKDPIAVNSGCIGCTGGSSTGGTGGTSGTGGNSGTGGTGGSSGAGGTGSSSGTGGIGGTSGVGGSSGLGGSGGTGGISGAGGTGGTSGTGGAGGTSGTGGTGGNTGGTGGDSGTGGVGGTGGNSGTGGASGTGGDSGTGGAGGTSGTGGTGSTGGTGGSSGAGGTGSSSGTGGVGGNTGGTGGVSGAGGNSGTGGSDAGDSGACVPAPLPPVDNSPMTPFGCTGGFGPDTRTNDVNLYVYSSITGASANDQYLGGYSLEAGSTAGYILRSQNGGNWVAETLPALVSVNPAVPNHYGNIFDLWVNDSEVWAAISVYQPPRYNLLHKQGPTWTLEQVGASDGSINGQAVWGFGSTVFAVMLTDPGQTYSTDINVYRKVGAGSWSLMTLPSHSLGTVVTRMWGRSESDVFMVGYVNDQTGAPTDPHQPVKVVLYHYDGCVWSDLSNTIPSDVVALWDISGAGGRVVVAGITQANPDTVGVTLVSSDLSSWTRFNSQQAAVYVGVWMPRRGAILAVGAHGDPESGSQYPGYARIAISSMDVCTETSVDSSAEGMGRLFKVPDTDEVLSLTSNVGVYKGHCQ